MVQKFSLKNKKMYIKNFKKHKAIPEETGYKQMTFLISVSDSSPNDFSPRWTCQNMLNMN